MVIELSRVLAAPIVAALVFWALGKWTRLTPPWVMFFTLLALLVIFTGVPLLEGIRVTR